MCGICGIWGKQPHGAIGAMVEAMYHRGPDSQGTYCDEVVALGTTRLAILDVSPSGRQPMTTPDQKIWIIYNGELYNFQSERDLLEAKGYTFASTSDTEVVLRLYEHYGDDFLLRLRGMFALAIYDKRGGPGHEKLLLARDQIGIKPLLYARRGSKLIFASEMKTMLASGLIEREIDPVALRMLLTFGSVYQPRTMLRDVQMLPPAHRLILKDGKCRVERYWSLGLNRRPEMRSASYEEQVEEVQRTLEETVCLQMVSDVPLGAFLSGGVDSSFLVALMIRMIGHRLKTFSVGFGEEGAALDESQDAQRMADFLGTDHTRVVVQASDIRDRLPHIVKSLDQPSVDGINSYFVSMAARQQVTVAISGTGGDEIFAGYPWFINMVLAQQKNHQGVRRNLLSFIARQPMFDPLLTSRYADQLQGLRTTVGFVPQYSTNYQIFGSLGSINLLSPALRRSAQAGRAPYYDLLPLDELSFGSAIERVSALVLRGYTNNQLLRDIDAMSMGHSLEVRVPYLDIEMVNLALSLPDSSKLGDVSQQVAPAQSTYRSTGAKRILIDAGRKFLPKDLDQQPKRGFSFPLDTWMRGSLHDVIADTLSGERVRQRGLLNPAAVASVQEQFSEWKLGWHHLWVLFILELWCEEILDRS